MSLVKRLVHPPGLAETCGIRRVVWARYGVKGRKPVLKAGRRHGMKQSRGKWLQWRGWLFILFFLLLFDAIVRERRRGCFWRGWDFKGLRFLGFFICLQCLFFILVYRWPYVGVSDIVHSCTICGIIANNIPNRQKRWFWLMMHFQVECFCNLRQWDWRFPPWSDYYRDPKRLNHIQLKSYNLLVFYDFYTQTDRGDWNFWIFIFLNSFATFS